VRWSPLLLLTSCVRFLDCPPSAEAGYDVAVEWFPSQALDYLDVKCKDETWGGLDCLTWAMGGPGAKARYEVRTDLAAPCIVHEAHHSQLYHDTGDDCDGHEETCGWDVDRIESATDQITGG